MMRVTSIPKDSMIIGESSQGVGPHLLPRVCLEALALSLIYIKLDLALTLSLGYIKLDLTDREDEDGGDEEEGEDHPVGCCQLVVVV